MTIKRQTYLGFHVFGRRVECLKVSSSSFANFSVLFLRLTAPASTPKEHWVCEGENGMVRKLAVHSE